MTKTEEAMSNKNKYGSGNSHNKACKILKARKLPRKTIFTKENMLMEEYDKVKAQNKALAGQVDSLKKQLGPCSCGEPINHICCTQCDKDWES